MQQTIKIIAGVVAHRPDPEELKGLVERLAPDVDAILIYANSPLVGGLEAALRACAGARDLVFLGSGANDGLGVAYNAFLIQTESARADFLLLFDQDSMPPRGMARGLAELHSALIKAGERPAVIGPRFADANGNPMWPPPPVNYSRSDGLAAEPMDCIISSGSLIDIAASRTVGPFRGDFFIDAIDVEWCFRARRRGFSIWAAKAIVMDHQVGFGAIKTPFGRALVAHSPARIYTMARNQLAMMRLAHVPLIYKWKIVAKLPVRIAIYLLHGSFSKELRHAVWRGVVDGLSNRLGPPGSRL
jgi:rhamnosyltransferase